MTKGVERPLLSPHSPALLTGSWNNGLYDQSNLHKGAAQMQTIQDLTTLILPFVLLVIGSSRLGEFVAKTRGRNDGRLIGVATFFLLAPFLYALHRIASN